MGYLTSVAMYATFIKHNKDRVTALKKTDTRLHLRIASLVQAREVKPKLLQHSLTPGKKIAAKIVVLLVYVL